MMNDLIFTLVIGAGATAITDIWGILRKHLLGILSPDFGLVGRWIAHMRYGRFFHKSIATSPPMPGECIIGWTAHYLIGIAFAVLLVGIWGPAWIQHPTPGPALLVGAGTVAAPFLLMQPGMGAGIAASRTPHPATARLHSFITHLIFGFGLYVAGMAIRFFYPS